MNIADLINKDGEKYSPYMSGLVNHLPMGQLALYKLTDDLGKVEEYTEGYLKRSSIDPVKESKVQVDSIEECLGERDLYKPCLDLLRVILEHDPLENLVSFVLNKYPLGMSSGLFHTTIRLAYAIEGYKIDHSLQEEVERALAYYITGYRKGDKFTREVSPRNTREAMYNMINNPKIEKIRKSNRSLGQKLEEFYGDKEFLEEGFIVEGGEEEKVTGILDVLVPAFYNTNNIVMLHTITGLHAVIVLQDYFDDYLEALDILATTAISHILTQEDLDISLKDTEIDESLEEIIGRVSDSKDVHTIKIGYTGKTLYKLFGREDLKYGIYQRLEKE